MIYLYEILEFLIISEHFVGRASHQKIKEAKIQNDLYQSIQVFEKMIEILYWAFIFCLIKPRIYRKLTIDPLTT